MENFASMLGHYLNQTEPKDETSPTGLICYDSQRPNDKKIREWCKVRGGKGPCPFLVTRSKAKNYECILIKIHKQNMFRTKKLLKNKISYRYE